MDFQIGSWGYFHTLARLTFRKREGVRDWNCAALTTAVRLLQHALMEEGVVYIKAEIVPQK